MVRPDFANAQIDGLTVPLLLGATRGGRPPVLAGHRLDGLHQIVLGAATLAQLHKRVGETVVPQATEAHATTPC